MYFVYEQERGQSAIEYLMSYGWMLLVVAVVGGAIFATVGDQNVDSVSGFTGGDVVVEDYGISSQEEIGLEVRSATGDGVLISKVNVSDPGTGEWVYKEFTGDSRVDVGSSKIFELPNVSRLDGSNSLDVEIIYDTGGLSNLSVSGTVSGSIELTDSGSYEGDPEDDHQSIDGGSMTLLDTVNYTYDASGDVQVNETTAGSSGYQVDLKNDFPNEVEEIKIVEMHGANGGDNFDSSNYGGSGGLVKNFRLNMSEFQTLDVWVGEEGVTASGGEEGGWGRSIGESATGGGGLGGGSTEIWADNQNAFIAAADSGGGAGWDSDETTLTAIGGDGARGGNAENVDPEGPNPSGGAGGSVGEDGNPGGQALISNSDIILSNGNQVSGGSSDGHGWILLEYYG